MHDLLKGVRILDLSTVVLGPYATLLLADMGADVIKVEPPEGDIFRAARPGRNGGDGAGFLNINRNKRSLALDLRQGEDRAILDRLLPTADVFVHNMRDASASRLGIDYSSIRRFKDDIIYCSARGFGAGPLGDEPAYDDCIQAASGMASLNADHKGEPRFVRTILCDKIAGLHFAFAIAAGVAARARTGQGVEIQTPMFEAMASFLLVEQLSGQSFIPPLPDRGYGRLNSPYRRPYPAQDGYVAIMPYTAAQWQRFLQIIGRDDLAHTPAVKDDAIRSTIIDSLYRIVQEAAPGKSCAEWLRLLREADIPCAPVNRLEDLTYDPHLLEAGFFKTMTHPELGELRYASTPFAVPGRQPSPDRPAPMLDADREAILGELDESD